MRSEQKTTLQSLVAVARLAQAQMRTEAGAAMSVACHMPQKSSSSSSSRQRPAAASPQWQMLASRRMVLASLAAAIIAAQSRMQLLLLAMARSCLSGGWPA